MALDAAPEELSRGHDREHQPHAQAEPESGVLVGTAMAGTGFNDGGLRGRHGLLVRCAEVSRAARPEGRGEHSIAPYLPKMWHARRGYTGTRIRLGPLPGRNLGDHRRAMACPPAKSSQRGARVTSDPAGVSFAARETF